MKDHSKKFNELKETTDSIFEGVLGYMAGKTPFGRVVDKDWNKQVSTSNLKDGLLFKSPYLQVNPDESVEFRNGSTAKEVITGWASLTKLNFESESYSWIVDGKAKFNIDGISVRNGLINFVKGDWYSGEFRGAVMYDVNFSGKGYFRGGLFKGGNWTAHAYNFIDGKWDVNGSILGMSNIENMNQNKFRFNLIAVTPGSKISIMMQDGKSHEIHVLKRLDAQSSEFKYKVKFADSDDVYPITVSWGFLRGKDKGEFESRTIFSNDNIPTLFEDKFSLKITSPIIKVSISPSTEVDTKIQRSEPEQEKTEQELAVTQQYYDLDKVTFLGIKNLAQLPPKSGGVYYNEKGIPVKNTIGRVYLHAPNSEYLKQFENVVKNLDNKFLASDFYQLRNYLANKVITGAPKGYPWLANLIGVDTSGNQLQEDKGLVDSLNRIEAFLKYFVSIIVKYAGKDSRQKGETNIPNTEVQELIKTNLKNYLGIKEEAPAASVNPEPETNVAPTSKPVKKQKVAESKSIKDYISKILSENLKHF